MKNNRTFMILVYLAIASIVVLGSKCKKDKPPTITPPPQITCTSNITDGCLDDWKSYSYLGGTYFDPSAGFLQSLNQLYALPSAAGGPGPITCDTVTDCVQGKYAARLTSKLFTVLGTPIFIPGYIGASTLDVPNQTIHLGKPYTLKPQKFHVYYKYAPVSGDSALIEVMLSKFISGTGKRDTISFNKVIVKNPVTAYTQLELPISYRDTINTPDTLVIVFAASAGINFNDVFHCYGQVGSALWVDDLKFIFP